MKFNTAGVLETGDYINSPNCDERPPDAIVRLIVIHNISLPPGQFGGRGIIELFTNCLNPAKHPYYETIKNLRVSSHFLIRRGGQIVQFVPCEQRAWHAGVSQWRDVNRCNDFSIGVELEGDDNTPFTDSQYQTLAELTASIKARYPIEDIVGHSDIAPGRKTDPGSHFDWARYRALITA